jgi:hypothetical protein
MRRLIAGVIAAGLVAAACSGDDPGVTAGRASEATDSVPVVAPTDVLDTILTTTPPATEAPVDTAAPATDPVATDPPATDAPLPAGDGWTVLVYSIADTDLEPFLLEDVGEMGEVGSGSGLDIVGLVDRASDYSSDPVLGIDDWHGAKLLHIEQNVATDLVDLGDINTGDPQVLADFITTGIQNYPAEHYALIISDHGASWPGVGGDESQGGDGLDLAELNAGIAAGLAGAGVDQLDLLGFDACLMATYEVASSLAPLAHRLVASQELEPGHGWDYRALQVLIDDPLTDVDTLGTAIVDGFEAQAQEQGTDAEITLSLIDLDQMPLVDAALLEFTNVLSPRAGALGATIGSTREAVLSFGRSPDPTEDTQMVDLGILVSQIGVEALDVSPQADALVRAINDVVLHSVEGAATRGATGLSIYFPPQPEYLSPDYAAVASGASWKSFLDAYYAGGDAIPVDEQPEFENADGIAEVFFDEDGLNISGVFDLAAQDNLSQATIDYGIVGDDGSITYIGSEPAAISDDGSGLALGIYDLTALTLTDGEDWTYAYLSLAYDEVNNIATVDVPMAYYASGDVAGETYQDVLLSLVVDGNTGDIISETYYAFDEAIGTYGELTADPAGLIFPELFLSTVDGTGEWIPATDIGLYADLPSLQYDLEALPSGTELYIELTVTDFGGNSDYVGAYVTIP